VGTGRTLRPPTTASAGEVFQLAFSPDGRLLAVAGTGLSLWDVDTHRRVGNGFPREEGWLPDIAFEPNGRLLIFQLNAIIEWPTDRPTLQRFACHAAGRELTPEEWRELVPNRPYRRVSAR
jgi:hypothetical protein